MVSIPQLVEILQRRDSPEAKKWIDALRKYRMRLTLKSAHRLNMVNYVCGQAPTKTKSWMSATKPHEKYQGNGPLEAVEVHLQNVKQTLGDVYDEGTWK